ncbi:CU044_5270 family protein [Nonomuraea zeae]|uniref:CU044_5270 family protein n=1 Tax=Nonomuraea zeae TaxID=1642303 RepID=A0A5S4GAB5_9ACTN|nr:CU044_5270 family protein [Nonomuraea zeae]TMR22930.1 hypothetical protein ETD85_48730 [Nonomuraea zeae]
MDRPDGAGMDGSGGADEIRVFAAGRPSAPPYRAEARERARERLLAEAGTRHGAGRFRLPRLGWQAAAAFGVTVVLVGGVAVALSNQGAGVHPAAQTSASVPVASAVLSGTPELDPRPGQFILIESTTMGRWFRMGRKGEVESRYLFRAKRKIWQSVDGSANGLLFTEDLAPKPWPGQSSLPDDIGTDGGGSAWHALPSCPAQPGNARRDHAFLSGLPAEAGAMRDHLYRVSDRSALQAKGIDPDAAAFHEVGNLVRETYLPRAQRDALFEAARTIPGVEPAEGVADAAGRKGVALGLPARDGTLKQLIFDPDTHLYLGDRTTVLDAKAAGAPKGSVVGSGAQTSVSVVDRLPKVSLSAGSRTACAAPEKQVSDAPAAPPASTPPSEHPSEPPSEHPSEPPTVSPQVAAPTEPPPVRPTGSPKVTAPEASAPPGAGKSGN